MRVLPTAAGVVVAAILVAAACAARPATSAEGGAIAAAVRAWDGQDGSSGLAERWAVMHRCAREVVRISTREPAWAAFWMRNRWAETDPRSARCAADGATVDGVWLARRTARGWVGRAWVYGDLQPSELCGLLRRAGIPVAVFHELDPARRTC